MSVDHVHATPSLVMPCLCFFFRAAPVKDSGMATSVVVEPVPMQNIRIPMLAHDIRRGVQEHSSTLPRRLRASYVVSLVYNCISEDT